MTNAHMILTSMGYRKLNKNKYIKPVGYNVFTFNLDTSEFLNIFKGANSKIHIYNGEKYEETAGVEDDFLQFIKQNETYSKLVHTNSNFEFLTREEQINFLL
jgi:hypothetical protein